MSIKPYMNQCCKGKRFTIITVRQHHKYSYFLVLQELVVINSLKYLCFGYLIKKDFDSTL